MEKKYVIVPYQGFDDVHFGEPRNSVRAKLGYFTEFKKNRLSRNSTDDFGDFHVFYDDSNRMEAIEFFESEVYLNQDRIFPQTKEDLLSLLSRLDSPVAAEGDSIVSKKLGISAYTPFESVESVFIYCQGYYD